MKNPNLSSKLANRTHHSKIRRIISTHRNYLVFKNRARLSREESLQRTFDWFISKESPFPCFTTNWSLSRASGSQVHRDATTLEIVDEWREKEKGTQGDRDSVAQSHGLAAFEVCQWNKLGRGCPSSGKSSKVIGQRCWDLIGSFRVSFRLQRNFRWLN